MPYDIKRFIFSVSLCAMLAVNPVLAETNLVEVKAGAKSGTPGVVSAVYSDWAGRATSGIAGVTYVNSAVDAAGNAAQWAENHAAAAAQSAKSAAESAAQAASKVSIDQGADNKNKAMVTDDAGSVYAGYVAPSMIADGGKIGNTTSYSGFVLWSDSDGNVSWKTADSEVLASGAVTSAEIASAAVTSGKIANGAVTADKLFMAGIPDGYSTTGFLAYSGINGDVEGGMIWRQVETDDIARGVVTTDKIADGAVTLGKIASPGQTGVLFSDGGVPSWRKIGSIVLESDAVTEGIIADGAVTADKLSIAGIPDGSSTTGFLAYSGTYGNVKGGMEWRQVQTDDIASGAVTIGKTAGVVGMVPVGAEGATTYGSFWIE